MSKTRRHRPDNILVLELDLPERTTYDYSAGMGAAQIQARCRGRVAGLGCHHLSGASIALAFARAVVS